VLGEFFVRFREPKSARSMSSPKNGRRASPPPTSLLGISSLPVSADRPKMRQQSSKMTDVSVSSVASNIAKLAGNFSKSLGDLKQGPFAVR
jgi:hypothetical protein